MRGQETCRIDRTVTHGEASRPHEGSGASRSRSNAASNAPAVPMRGQETISANAGTATCTGPAVPMRGQEPSDAPWRADFEAGQPSP